MPDESPSENPYIGARDGVEPNTVSGLPDLFDLEEELALTAEEDDLLQRLVYPLDTQTLRVAWVQILCRWECRC